MPSRATPRRRSTLDFKPLAGGKTEMTMVQTRFPDPTATANHNRGWDMFLSTSSTPCLPAIREEEVRHGNTAHR